jgi:hypothetical protein
MALFGSSKSTAQTPANTPFAASKTAGTPAATAAPADEPPPAPRQAVPQIRAITTRLIHRDAHGNPVAARDYRVVGNFVYIDTAATAFELSFDGSNYIPMREGRMIQTRGDFDTLYLRAAGTDVDCVLILGYGGITSFAGYGGGIGSYTAAPLMPYETPAALGNAPTMELKTGVYAIIIDGSPPSARTWQLRAWIGADTPATDPAAGLIVPVDYTTANKRVWFRV